MKKSLLLLILITTLVGGIKSVNAVELTAIDGTVITDENRSEYMCKNPYGEMIFPDNLEYDGKKISLFCEYKDEDSAMGNYILNNQKILSYIEDTYNIESLNKNNWKKYQDYINSILVEEEFDEELLKQAENSRVFFGLYKDKYINIVITDIVDTLKKQLPSKKTNELINELNGITPYYGEKISLHEGLIYHLPEISIFTIITLTIYIFVLYKIFKNPKKLKENKDKLGILILKQVLNGISLALFLKITFNNVWPSNVYSYELFYSPDIGTDIYCFVKGKEFLSLILIILCLSLVLYKKNSNEYLKLITYSELIIIPLILLSLGVFNTSYINSLIYSCLDYLVKILNIILPLIFYLKLSNKKKKKAKVS